MAVIASWVFFSFSRMKIFFTLSAFSYASFAVASCCSLRESADFSIWSRVAYWAARSSRPAWIAAFTLAVRSFTSFLYLVFSFSSRVTFARTIAIDSFISRDLVVHVPDVLLEDQLRVFDRADEEADEAAHRPSKAVPHGGCSPRLPF